MRPAAYPTVTIIIPAYNEEEVIVKCLESCIDQSVPADEILVVNNNSTDRTAALVRQFIEDHPNSKVVLMEQNEEQGLIPTRNFGFEHAAGEVLGRIDADSLLTHDWVKEVKKTFADPTVDGASGPVIYHDMPLRQVAKKVDEEIRKALHKMAIRSDHRFMFGSNMAIRRSAWKLIKDEVCLDKENLLHEDIDLALHLYQKGLHITFAPKMVGGMSVRRLEDNPRKFYNYVMRFERTFKAHGVKSASARIPIFIYLSTYFPLKLLYSAYDNDTKKLSLKKLRESMGETDERGGARH